MIPGLTTLATKMLTPTQPRPLRQTIRAAVAVISFALVCAVILYVTEGLLFLRSHISDGALERAANLNDSRAWTWNYCTYNYYQCGPIGRQT
jgi:hypothetical protein